jgi:hypothetical protein
MHSAFNKVCEIESKEEADEDTLRGWGVSTCWLIACEFIPEKNIR